ncbi:hypothetical protein Pcinc_038636 [Petrolisthes cinctipes]|uniref:Uncharacterized protein n=1 Tax=Petrolisthes cinctipes TaxID=88211 RepID=A0AAE1BT95_PETCI|nr:hypothetical protein Pcinc_038636 [Petrolisthes cinctipes]
MSSGFLPRRDSRELSSATPIPSNPSPITFQPRQPLTHPLQPLTPHFPASATSHPSHLNQPLTSPTSINLSPISLHQPLIHPTFSNLSPIPFSLISYPSINLSSIPKRNKRQKYPPDPSINLSVNPPTFHPSPLNLSSIPPQPLNHPPSTSHPSPSTSHPSPLTSSIPPPQPLIHLPPHSQPPIHPYPTPPQPLLHPTSHPTPNLSSIPTPLPTSPPSLPPCPLRTWSRVGCWFSANHRCSRGNSSSGSKLVLIRVFWGPYWLVTVWEYGVGELGSWGRR